MLATVTLLASSIVDNAYVFMGQASFPSPINSPDLDVKQNADRTPPPDKTGIDSRLGLPVGLC